MSKIVQISCGEAFIDADKNICHTVFLLRDDGTVQRYVDKFNPVKPPHMKVLIYEGPAENKPFEFKD